MTFSKDFDLFSAIQKVRLSEKTSEILGQVSEKMKLESLAGLLWIEARYTVFYSILRCYFLHVLTSQRKPSPCQQHDTICKIPFYLTGKHWLFSRSMFSACCYVISSDTPSQSTLGTCQALAISRKPLLPSLNSFIANFILFSFHLFNFLPFLLHTPASRALTALHDQSHASAGLSLVNWCQSVYLE